MLDHLDMAIGFTVVMLAVSLLITVFVQTASAVLGLRGTNLRWGLDQLLRTLHPDLAAHSESIADRILQHPLISDSTMSRFAGRIPIPGLRQWMQRLHYAKAIRVEEFVGIMGLVAGRAPVPATLEAATSEAERASYIVSNILATTTDVAAAQAAVVPAPAGAAGQHTVSMQGLEFWFDSTMDRVSQRFAVQMRIWTVVFAVIVAFALHLDSFRLIAQLSSAPDARARLTSAADTLQRAADGIVSSSGVSAPSTSTVGPPVLYHDVMLRQPAVSSLSAAGVAVPGFFPDRVTAAGWLRGALVARSSPDAEIEKAVASYQEAIDHALAADIDTHEAAVRRLSDQALTVRSALGDAGFQLVPDPYHSWDISPWWPSTVWAGVGPTTVLNLLDHLFLVRPSNLHFWGILFSAGLLSLGAPFWYSALKTLSALKPVVAQKENDERTAREGGR